jgi:hypothetical protein
VHHVKQPCQPQAVQRLRAHGNAARVQAGELVGGDSSLTALEGNPVHDSYLAYTPGRLAAERRGVCRNALTAAAIRRWFMDQEVSARITRVGGRQITRNRFG